VTRTRATPARGSNLAIDHAPSDNRLACRSPGPTEPEPTHPCSTRNAAPVLAEASGLHGYPIRFATSSTVANRFSSELGRAVWKKSCSTWARSIPY
jgi:hypothetical protein